jgi:DNA uptake protein ComE-like DNA-binding protein
MNNNPDIFMIISKRILNLSTILLITLSIGFAGCADNKPAEMAEEPTMQAAPVGTPTMEAAAPKINLNTATKEDFLTVPGVGDRMVREFMEYRPYASIGQFRREMGKYVDEAQVAEYEKYLYVPVDPNNSDAETIMQIPGIDQSVIEELDLVKPFPSKEAFLETLSEFVTPTQLQAAENFLVEE